MGTETGTALVDEGVEHFDAREFRRCLSQYATGVTIITSCSDAGPFGVTANSFSSLSLDPPLVLWSIGRTSRSFDSFVNAPSFTINILSSDQIDLSQKFSSKAEDKFAGVKWMLGSNGAPLLAGTLAAIECRQHRIFDGGDHVIIVGKVNRFSTFAGDGLLFAQGRYRMAADHPRVMSDSQLKATSSTVDPSPAPTSFFMQLFWAFHYMSENFDEYRRAANVTLPQGRVLSRLDGTHGLSLEELVTRTYLTSRACEDAIAELASQNCIIRTADGRYALTSTGRTRRELLAENELKFENLQMANVSPQDFAATRRVLAQIIKMNGGEAVPS